MQFARKFKKAIKAFLKYGKKHTKTTIILKAICTKSHKYQRREGK